MYKSGHLRPSEGFPWPLSPPCLQFHRTAPLRRLRSLAFFPVCFLDAPERRPGLRPVAQGVCAQRSIGGVWREPAATRTGF